MQRAGVLSAFVFGLCCGYSRAVSRAGKARPRAGHFHLAFLQRDRLVRMRLWLFSGRREVAEVRSRQALVGDEAAVPR